MLRKRQKNPINLPDRDRAANSTRRALRFLVIAVLLTVGAGRLSAQPTPDSPPPSRLIPQLIDRLDAPALKTRNLAERQLLALGPEVLDWLDDKDPGWGASAETRHRLKRLRGQLFNALLQQTGRETTVRVEASWDAEQTARQMNRQSGNRLHIEPPADFRAAPAGQYPFWNLIEILCRQNRLVPEFRPERALWLVAASEEQAEPQAIGNAGPVRMEWLPEADSAGGFSEPVRLRLFWEPRMQVIGIRVPLADVSISDQHGQLRTDFNRQAILAIPAAAGRNMVRFRLPLNRTSGHTPQRLEIRPRLSVIAPPAEATFRDFIETRELPQPVRIGMATISLHEVKTGRQGLRVQLLTRYASGQMAEPLQSHLDWGQWCSATLIDDQGRTVPPSARQQIRQNSYEYLVEFQFELPPGRRDAWQLKFKIPSGLIQVEETITLEK